MRFFGLLLVAVFACGCDESIAVTSDVPVIHAGETATLVATVTDANGATYQGATAVLFYQDPDGFTSLNPTRPAVAAGAGQATSRLTANPNIDRDVTVTVTAEWDDFLFSNDPTHTTDVIVRPPIESLDMGGGILLDVLPSVTTPEWTFQYTIYARDTAGNMYAVLDECNLTFAVPVNASQISVVSAKTGADDVTVSVILDPSAPNKWELGPGRAIDTLVVQATVDARPGGTVAIECESGGVSHPLTATGPQQ
jgi:hypothetical protein